MARNWSGAGLAATVGLALLVVPATRADEQQAQKQAEQAQVKAEKARVRVERAMEQAEKARARADERFVVRLGGGGFLGVSIEDVGADDVTRLKLPAEAGARVTQVEEDSPAAKAGVKKDDVIVRFGGESVRSTGSLLRLVRETPPGREVELEVVRGGATQRLQATIDEHAFGDQIRREVERSMARVPSWVPAPPAPPDAPGAPDAARAPRAPMPPTPPMPPMPPMMRWNQGDGPAMFFHGFERGPRKLGISYQDVDGQFAQFLKIQGGKGVIVTEVEADSPAAKGGLKAGDVIVRFAGQAVADGDDFRDAVSESDPGTEVVIAVSREGKPVEVKVTLGGEREQRRQRRGSAT